MKLVDEGVAAKVKYGGFSEEGPGKTSVGALPYTIGDTIYVPKSRLTDKVSAMKGFLFEINNAVRQPRFAEVSKRAKEGKSTAAEYAQKQDRLEVEGMLRMGKVWTATKAVMGGGKEPRQVRRPLLPLGAPRRRRGEEDGGRHRHRRREAEVHGGDERRQDRRAVLHRAVQHHLRQEVAPVADSLRDLLDAVRNDDVTFATVRPPDSDFAILDRRVVVVSPPELERLAASGDPEVLDALVDLLRDPARAWAAQVLLSAMTRREEKEVEAFSTQPEEWWDVLGEGAHERWRTWLDETRERLQWDPDSASFVEREG